MAECAGSKKAIQPIDKSSIQKICCGQVIVDLCSAVKEILENSLDSGATSIEIKLKEMGVESIEVSDNGSGIDKTNYETLALKHHTSKLSEFADLENGNVTSFGFRGEALNAVCELSRSFSVSTKQEGEKVGYALSFQRNGKLTGRRPIARPTGTTVRVDGLFEALPVRRGDFVRSIKKQYQKMVKVVSSYAVVSVGVNISVTNISKTGSRQNVLSTQSSSRMEDNISSVFGSKFTSTLMPLQIQSRDKANFSASPAKDKTSELYNEIEAEGNNCVTNDVVNAVEHEIASEATVTSNTFTCAGFVSKPREGVGRSDSDRQYVFVNSRPVDIPRINRVMNEMWRRFEMAQKPAFILNITLAGHEVDVNLAPDKREVLIPAEGEIIDALRTELEVKFAPTRNTFAVNSGGFQQPLNSFLTAGAPWPTSPLAFLDKPHSTSTTVTSTAVSSGETVESIPVALSCDENIISSVSVAEDNMVESQGSFTLSQTQSSQDSGISSVKSTSESSPPVVADEKPLPRSRNPSRSSKKERRMLWLERESAPHSTLPPVDGKDWSSDAGMRSNCESGNQDTRKKRQRIVLSDDEDNDSCGGGGVNDTEPPGYTKDEEDEDEDGLTSEIRSYVTHKRRAPWGNSMSSRDTCTKKSQNYSQKINKEDDIKDPSDNNEKDCNKADDIIEDSKANGDMCEEEDDDESTIDNKIGDDNDSEKSIDIGGSEVNDDVIDMEVDEEVEVVEKDEKEKGDECAEKVTASNRSFNGCSSDDDNDDGATLNDESVTWNFDPEKVLDLHKIMTLSRRNDTTFRTRKRGVHFKAADTNSRVLSKGDFAGMRVLGQFNLGFIIAQLDDDLYILDQHACDEKFIFEKLSRETVVHKQPLLVPMILEATPSEEILIQDHISIFEANGFKIQVQEDSPPGRRLRLVTVPFSKHIVFDHKDVHELAALIGAIDKLTGGISRPTQREQVDGQDKSKIDVALESGVGVGGFTASQRESNVNPVVVDSALEDSVIPNLVLKNITNLQACVSSVQELDNNSSGISEGNKPTSGPGENGVAAVRLPKLLSAFASRACRSAVMIGTALKKNDMSNIVAKLGTIEQPWNCPHGRPTMRHLTDLSKVSAGQSNIIPEQQVQVHGRLPYHRLHILPTKPSN